MNCDNKWPSAVINSLMPVVLLLAGLINFKAALVAGIEIN